MVKTVEVLKDGTVVLYIGSSDKNADWLKEINKGKNKKDDIAATDKALEMYKKDK